jgi:oligopeptide transporter, OPT family
MSGSTAPTAPGVRELTIRGVVIGGLITLVFTAANVYLGLKVGLTFATSIPAAVISMAILRNFRDHSVVENNIVQTIASAAGTLSAIIFVLPGLVMIGWWTGFPYWQTALVTALGGVLGVMYSIPLRRALVTGSDLPFPEGVAAAEVLRVGDSAEGAQENRRGLMVIIVGSLLSAGFSLLAAMKVVAGNIERAFRVGSGGSMVSAGLSLALIGVGHLVGITVGIAMIVGLVISFGVMLPLRTAGRIPAGDDLGEAVSTIFSSDVRFVGAGAMAIAAVWTLVKIALPIGRGIKEALASTRARESGAEVPVVERDLSVRVVAGVTLASMLPIGLLLWLFVRNTPIAHHAAGMVVVSILFVLLIGLAVAGVCGYMAGLIGASNSPISGVGILIAITAALLIKVVHGAQMPGQGDALIAYTLFTAAVVFGVATISNDNLQDLKTGQLVEATPWKQQVALVIGVVFGSLIIPPVLQLLNTSFGFAGAPGATSNALAAPQAALLSSLAKGVFGGDLDWGLLGLGIAIGAAVVVVDELLGRATGGGRRLPPLAVGMGMYLPMSLTLIIPVGALAGLIYDRWAEGTADPEGTKRLSTLAATGLIVGESLFGVVLAGVVAATGEDEPLAVVGPGFTTASEIIGTLLFAGTVLGLYLWVKRRSVGAMSAHVTS